MPVKSSGVLLERGARKLGLHPFPAPLAINSMSYGGRSQCVHCGFCHGMACEVAAKASSLTTVIPEAEATGCCEVRPESYVVRIETNARGRVSGVAYFDNAKHEHFQKARAVVVCANGARPAPAAHVGQHTFSRRARELEWTRRQVSDVQLHRAGARRLRTRVE
jgi:choline dehydrogenase-like flavoprotein